jgi:NAD(P)-dependent dehydrogenase (short-subunit alcohol dehydrogenase family)
MISDKPKKILITGGTSGLGYELAGYFIRSGDEVYVTGRDSSKLSVHFNKVHFIRIDFADLAEVQKKTASFLTGLESPGIVINNAGVLAPYKFIQTKDNFEYTIQINFLAHLLINEMILRNKSDNDPLTIVSVTSPVYKYYKAGFKMPAEKKFHSFRTYSESKIYLLLLGEYLASRYPGKNLNYFSFDPGIFRSGLSRGKKKWFRILYKAGTPFMRSPEKAAGRLFEILSDDTTGSGKIYTTISKFRETDELTRRTGEHFLAECSLKLEKYL